MEGAARERRWLLLAETGDHSWLGRATDPSEDEIGAAEASLRRAGVGGWMAVGEGDYWSRGLYTLLEVRALNSPSHTFSHAKDLFLERRSIAVASAS